VCRQDKRACEKELTEWCLADVKRRDTGLYQFLSGGAGGVVLWAVDPHTGAAHATPVKMPTGSGHRDVTCVAFSPSQLFAAAGTTAGDLFLVDTVKRSAGRLLPIAGGGIHSVRWVSESLVACGTREGVLVVVDTASPGEPVAVLRQRISVGGVTSLDWDGEALLAGCDDGRLVRVPVPRELGASEAAAPREVEVLQDGHGPQGKGVDDGVGSRGSSGAALSASHASSLGWQRPGSVNCVSFAPGVSDAFVTGGADGTVRLWDGSNYSVVSAAREREAGVPLCLAQSIDFLSVGWQDGSLRGYSGETLEHLFTIPKAHSSGEGVTSVVISGNERFAVSGGGNGSVRVWELRSRDMVCDMREHSSAVTSIALFRDDVHAVTVSRDHSMVCWDLRRERRVSSHMQRMGGINSVILSQDQSIVITAGQAKNITLWDLREPQPIMALGPAHGEFEVTTLAALSKREVVVSGGGDGCVKLWDLRNGKCVSTGVGHSAKVQHLAVAGDDRQVVSVGDDGCVLVWNVFPGTDE
jgi:cilia- and flagella-associated protein 52